MERRACGHSVGGEGGADGESGVGRHTPRVCSRHPLRPCCDRLSWTCSPPHNFQSSGHCWKFTHPCFTRPGLLSHSKAKFNSTSPQGPQPPSPPGKFCVKLFHLSCSMNFTCRSRVLRVRSRGESLWQDEESDPNPVFVQVVILDSIWGLKKKKNWGLFFFFFCLRVTSIFCPQMILKIYFCKRQIRPLQIIQSIHFSPASNWDRTDGHIWGQLSRSLL